MVRDRLLLLSRNNLDNVQRGGGRGERSCPNFFGKNFKKSNQTNPKRGEGIQQPLYILVHSQSLN